MKPTPRFEVIVCKHCGAVVALIPGMAIVGRFTLRCIECDVRAPIWPREPKDEQTLDKNRALTYDTSTTPV